MTAPLSSRLSLLLVLLCGCATPTVTRPSPPAPGLSVQTWQSALHRDHPLAGRIWDVQRGQWIDEAGLKRELARARYVLLGEKHDNADHHRLQAQLVDALASSGRRPVLAFEMLDVKQQAAVDQALARAPRDPDALALAVDWAHSGWPDWSLYRPIFAAGLEHGLPVLAANLPRDQVRGIVMQGPSAMEAGERGRLGLDTQLAPEVAKAMREEMRESHCGQLPDEILEPMVLAQRARDAEMADRVFEADRGDGVILITGAGHARADRGVPAHLAHLAPDRPVASLGFVEVSPEAREPKDYVASFGGDRLPFDYVWFTPAAERPDPCEALRKRQAPAKP